MLVISNEFKHQIAQRRLRGLPTSDLFRSASALIPSRVYASRGWACVWRLLNSEYALGAADASPNRDGKPWPVAFAPIFLHY